jgi:hypothetical protein
MFCPCLGIETGRYTNTPKNIRICTYCNTTDFDDEFHFVLKCNFVSDLRIKYVKKYYYIKPSSFKLIQLLSTQNVKELHNLGMFFKTRICIQIFITVYSCPSTLAPIGHHICMFLFDYAFVVICLYVVYTLAINELN